MPCRFHGGPRWQASGSQKGNRVMATRYPKQDVRAATTPYGVMEQFITKVHSVLDREDIEDLVQAPSFLTAALKALKEEMEPGYYPVHEGWRWIHGGTGISFRKVPYYHACDQCRSEDDLVVEIQTEKWGQTTLMYHLRPNDRWQHLQGHSVWIRRSDDGSGILARIKN
jgi:hypothetical protein